MPAAEVEATLQQLDLVDQPAAATTSTQHCKQQQQPACLQHHDDPQETPAALQNTACLAATFSWLDSERSLLRCSGVCRLWQSVLEADDIWRRVYLRRLPEPLPYERVGSYRQQFRRLRGLLDPPEIQPTALKGSALCYNAATGHLVSYNARQRVLSVLMGDGCIRSEVAEVDGAAGTAHRPLLASTGSELVLLAAADGAVQLWDASCCACRGVLGRHESFVTSLSASGHLAASSCSKDMRLWDLDRRACLYVVPIGLPLPSPVLEPHVAVCHEQQLLALANCAAPAPCSVVKVYSTHPAPPSSKPAIKTSSSIRYSGGSTWPAGSAADPSAAAAAAAAAVSVVGDSSCPGAVGALLLKELPVTAAADMRLSQGLLLVASCFHGRAVSNNSPFRSERPYTVVVNVYETRSWQCTRLVSPRLWTDTPMFSMQGTPMIAVTQGVVYCATLRQGSNAFPSCAVHAMQLPAAVATAGVTSTNSTNSSSRQGTPPAAAASAAAGSGAGGGGGRSRAQGEGASSIGTGAVAEGRVAVATAGGVGPLGLSASQTVMLSVSDQDRQSWCGNDPLVADTGGMLTVLLTTPTQLVMATESGQVFSSQLLPTEPPQQQQQQGSGGPSSCGSAVAVGDVGGGEAAAVAPVVHVYQPHPTGSRFVSLDL